MRTIGVIIICLLGSAGAVHAVGGFFEIREIDYLTTAPRKGPAAYRKVPVLGKEGKPSEAEQTLFMPCLAVRVLCEDQVKASSTLAKAYFYDRDRKLIDKVEKPSPAGEAGAREFHPSPSSVRHDLCCDLKTSSAGW